MNEEPVGGRIGAAPRPHHMKSDFGPRALTEDPEITAGAARQVSSPARSSFVIEIMTAIPQHQRHQMVRNR
jgi:hypothetical protein